MEGHYFFKSMDKHKPGYMDTFAVIARLYKIKEQFKTNSNPHAKFLSEVEQPGSVFEVPSIHHERFRLGQLLGNLAWPFIHYKGSLTYPPCLETYDWMVSLNHLNVGIAEVYLITYWILFHFSINNFSVKSFPKSQKYNR